MEFLKFKIVAIQRDNKHEKPQTVARVKAKGDAIIIIKALTKAVKEMPIYYKIEEEQKDLFKYYEEQPEELQRVLKPYEEHNPTTDSLKEILKEVEAIGYTFDYGLDANPYNLRKM